jgi:DnaA family protein
MNDNLKQLALNLCLKDNENFENFFVGPNEKIVTILKNIHNNRESSFVFLWGKSGTGKSHLLSALCQLFNDHGLTAAYLPLDEMTKIGTESLNGLDQFDFLGIDDLHLVSGNLKWEEAIFYCFNKFVNNRKHIIITADIAPQALPLVIPDLKSRMTSDLIFAILELKDEEKINCIKLRAKLRGLDLNDIAARFILHNYSRDTKNLCIILETLDKKALESQRRLTVPFIKHILG